MAYQARSEDHLRLASEWEGLLRQSGRSWPFLQPSWQRVWWAEQAKAEQAGEAESLLLSVRDGERLIGVAPLLQRGERLAFAGDPEIMDYMDIACAPGHEEAVLDAVFAALASRPWQRCILWGLRADSPTLPALQRSAARAGMALEIEQEAVCPRVLLAPSWDAYLEGLGKHDRHELRRKLRRFGALGGEARDYVLCSPAEVVAALDDFFHLHTISRQDKAEFMTPAMQGFFRAMTAALAAEDRIRLHFLELDGRRVASVLAFDVEGELWLYNSGFDPTFASESVGLVSKALVLQRAIAEGKRCYDFLRGAEPYKYHLGAQDLRVLRCTIHRDPAAVPSESPHVC